MGNRKVSIPRAESKISRVAKRSLPHDPARRRNDGTLVLAKNCHKKITGLFYNPVIFLISLSLLSASRGVSELMSNPLISSRICLRTGSSS